MNDANTTASGRAIRAGADWNVVDAGYGDVRYETSRGIAKITICRPEVRNAFRPETVRELIDAFGRARDDHEIGVVLLTGEGDQAFCSGGDQRVRGDSGYVAEDGPSGNTVGRVANKGMEGLAITPDGRTLVGVMQAPLEQDTNSVIRLVSIDIRTGTTHEYAYQLTTGSGVSDIVAINNHEFLLDERDGKGLGDGSKAKVKQLFRVNLTGAADISGKSGNLSGFAVAKTLFLDILAQLNSKGITSDLVPAKIEGTTFGPDVKVGGATRHTLYIANDNDFLSSSGGVDNPNEFFVFAFDDQDLPGFQPQPVREQEFLECGFDFEIF